LDGKIENSFSGKSHARERELVGEVERRELPSILKASAFHDPYWKPTLVGRCECTKVSNEGTLRNSAK